jgi:hypothetical protein
MSPLLALSSKRHLLSFDCGNQKAEALGRVYCVCSAYVQLMFSLLALGMLGGMVGLVIYELIQEVRGGANDLHDHYHE